MKNKLDKILRVDHAGEVGAAKIYEGQLRVLGKTDVGPMIQHMKDQEKEHLDTFNQLLNEPISKSEIISTYSGVRPLIKSKDNFHKSTRDFFIQENDSLLTIFGGKWTTSPSIARKIVTMI